MHPTWPAFWAGKMASNRESMLLAIEASESRGAFNLGQLIGLHGLATLIPLLTMWGAVAGLWLRLRRES
jgi:hypothetical protein